MSPEAIKPLITNYTDIILVISGLIVAFTVWLRKERIANAKTDVEVKAQLAEKKKHEGQNTELDILIARITLGEVERGKLVVDIATQGDRIRALEIEINQLEIILMGISILFNNMLLCEDCRVKNKDTVEAIKSLLAKIKEAKKDAD